MFLFLSSFLPHTLLLIFFSLHVFSLFQDTYNYHPEPWLHLSPAFIILYVTPTLTHKKNYFFLSSPVRKILRKTLDLARATCPSQTNHYGHPGSYAQLSGQRSRQSDFFFFFKEKRWCFELMKLQFLFVCFSYYRFKLHELKKRKYFWLKTKYYSQLSGG